jgi:hypothetical protein
MAAVNKQEQEEEKSYVLMTAAYGQDHRKLHWVVVEKQKNKGWYLKGKPVESLCGKRGPPMVEDFSANSNQYDDKGFVEYSESDFPYDRQLDLDHGHIRHERRLWNPKL